MIGIDLFCGAGGMSIGASMAGITTAVAADSDQRATHTYAFNHPQTKVICADIRKLTANHLISKRPSAPTIIYGGPPCQGFSTSNQKNRDANNPKNWLFAEFLRITRELRPNWVVIENVKGLLETEGGYFLETILRRLKRAGYTTSTFVLDSSNYGVPQRRKRLFIVGSIDGVSVSEPHPTTLIPITVRDAISDLPTLRNGSSQDFVKYSKKSLSSYAEEMRSASGGCWNNLVTNNAPEVVERYAYIPQGGNWKDIPESLMDNYADRTRCHTGIYKRLRYSEPSVVIGNFRKNMLIHPTQNRGLSVREAARLQSIPDDYRFFGSIGFQQQQVGNAVPPKLALAIFNEILKHV